MIKKSDSSMKSTDMKSKAGNEKLIIYQLFPRIFTNTNPTCKPWGTLEENGSGKLTDLSPKLLKEIRQMGVNCLWLTGVIEHATKTAFPEDNIPADNPNVVKGEAGSAYAIKDYYDIAPAIATVVKDRMNEFEQTVNRIHKENLKVIIDFVPNHTARVYHSNVAPAGVKDFGEDDNKAMCFSPSNNYYYVTNQQFSPNIDLSAEGDEPYVEFPAKATGNDCFSAFCSVNDWYETVKLNYGHDYGDNSDHFDPVPDTWLKMLSILRFWASKDIDGFRCDMVFLVPIAFWHWAIPEVKKDFPNIIFIGEIYDIGQYRSFLDYGCFDYLYDKVNLYDTLVGIEKYNFSVAQITGCWQAVDGIGDKMLNFLENHDEVRFGSLEFAGTPEKVIPFLVTSAMISNGPFLIYYGQELGESGSDNEGFAGNNNRSTIFDYWSYSTLRRWYMNGKCDGAELNMHEKWLRNIYSKILNMCNDIDAIGNGKFFDLMYVNLQNPAFNPHRLFSWIRYDEKEAYLFLANFGERKENVEINIPYEAIQAAGLSQESFQTEDLLWNTPQYISVSSTSPTKLEINGYDAMIIPLRKNRIKP